LCEVIGYGLGGGEGVAAGWSITVGSGVRCARISVKSTKASAALDPSRSVEILTTNTPLRGCCAR
jgi:hypothetical protein